MPCWQLTMQICTCSSCGLQKDCFASHSNTYFRSCYVCAKGLPYLWLCTPTLQLQFLICVQPHSWELRNWSVLLYPNALHHYLPWELLLWRTGLLAGQSTSLCPVYLGLTWSTIWYVLAWVCTYYHKYRMCTLTEDTTYLVLAYPRINGGHFRVGVCSEGQPWYRIWWRCEQRGGAGHCGSSCKKRWDWSSPALQGSNCPHTLFLLSDDFRQLATDAELLLSAVQHLSSPELPVQFQTLRVVGNLCYENGK